MAEQKDKVRELAEQLYCEEGDRWADPEYIEREIQEALTPLLEIAQAYLHTGSAHYASALAAELEGWLRKE